MAAEGLFIWTGMYVYFWPYVFMNTSGKILTFISDSSVMISVHLEKKKHLYTFIQLVHLYSVCQPVTPSALYPATEWDRMMFCNAKNIAGSTKWRFCGISLQYITSLTLCLNKESRVQKVSWKLTASQTTELHWFVFLPRGTCTALQNRTHRGWVQSNIY